MLEIPDSIFEDIAVENAKYTLFRNDITPKQYEEFYKNQYGKRYATEAMADAGNPIRVDDDTT